MTTAVLERDRITAELNHSCTSQCPNPCPASSCLERPEVETGVITIQG